MRCNYFSQSSGYILKFTHSNKWRPHLVVAGSMFPVRFSSFINKLNMPRTRDVRLNFATVELHDKPEIVIYHQQ